MRECFSGMPTAGGLQAQEWRVTDRKPNDMVEDLPETLAIFPLAKAVLLPRQILPLNIFEPRYLAMVEDALKSDRHIGMIQPQAAHGESIPVPVYDTGCAGRITAFQETEDGRILINLKGICRFRIVEELESERGYRRVRPDWRSYMSDLEDPQDSTVDMSHLETTLRGYLESHDLQASWDAMRELPAAQLVDFLAMHLPLAVEDKQTLVELPSASERARALLSVLPLPSGDAPVSNRILH